MCRKRDTIVRNSRILLCPSRCHNPLKRKDQRSTLAQTLEAGRACPRLLTTLRMSPSSLAWAPATTMSQHGSIFSTCSQ
eukprot:225840-Pyramimonas_sp.AAC.1